MKSLRKFLLSCAVLLMFLHSPAPASAHPLDNGYSTVTIFQNTVSYDLFLPEICLFLFDTDDNGKLDSGELQLQQPKIQRYLSERLQVKNDGVPMGMTIQGIEKKDKDVVPGVTFHLEFTSPEDVKTMQIHYDLLFNESDPGHINFLILMDGSYVEQTVFDKDNRDYVYQSAVPRSMYSALWVYFKLGVEHILSGYDHLLFLFSLLLIAANWRAILQIVTAFTVAHSITLFLAASGRIQVSPAWVEMCIALSIGYVAIENLLVKKTGKRWLLTFFFGLIHGMGFAGALSEIGLPKNHFISSLLSFNVGVEAGQLLVVALVMPILLSIRKQPWGKRFIVASSCMILIASVYLIFQRVGTFIGS